MYVETYFVLLILPVIYGLPTIVTTTTTARTSTITTVSPRPVTPVILFPGDGGSQIEASLDRLSVLHSWCTQKTKDWFSLWLNLEFLIPGATACFADNMKLLYDPVKRTTFNQPGVSLRVPGFGNTTSIEYMDPSENTFTIYYAKLVDYLVSKKGYSRNSTVRGVPYDFRKAPNEMSEYVHNVVSLIEETYKTNKNERVSLIGHSLGNLYILYILNSQSQAWKDKYIRQFISLGAPYGGAIKTVKLFASGYNLDIVGLNELTMRDEQRAMPSSAFLLPYDSFWSDNEVMVSGPMGNYTVKDYERFFNDINFPDGYLMRQDTEHLIKDLSPPGVEVHCLYGTDVPTPESYVYGPVKKGAQWNDWKPKQTINGQGDGTVNLRSLVGCERWVGKQKAGVKLQGFTKVGHLEMLRDANLINYVSQLLS